ncbi:D-2-hydroxyacid dehydrogenase [Arthrobacter sp. AQ5-05]|uniref:D-2-hydroxyacid dehydrogenase n=1 Tax=Arthrobacter sp. AQ5-05 TaxID=2184581 RepID=UPI000DCBA14B|nr:D-2-hydroxyacid dehydrogenase [Arthrobacter sp. AQ5-05]RAX49381.1 D-2-hydroxyacid dehydrogenase [Arthrobacter sp. AQ5-05]
MRPQVLICSFLQEELVDRLIDATPEVDVIYRPELLPVPQFEADHWGKPRELTQGQLAEWQGHLANATIKFDFDWWQPRGWQEHSPLLEWIQASQAGVGARAAAMGHTEDKVRITTAAGVHAKPLAEFALAGLLHFIRELPRLESQRRAHRWTNGASQTLHGLRALIIGAGSIGGEVARTLSFMGVSCDGTTRGSRLLDKPFERSVSLQECQLGEYDIVVLACPLTEETAGLMDKRRLSEMKQGAFLVNLARGPVIDQEALLDMLAGGHLGGAVLDVANPEPLPAGHPLWDAPNLILSPHTAANVDAENARLVELFTKNLRRYLDGEALLNTYDPFQGY